MTTTITDKRKRQSHAPSYLPLYLARLGFILASLYTLISLIKSEAMFNIYAPIAGVMMWFYWVIIAGCLYLSMQAQRYRLAGEPIKARATHVTMLAIAVMSTGAFSVVITGF